MEETGFREDVFPSDEFSIAMVRMLIRSSSSPRNELPLALGAPIVVSADKISGRDLELIRETMADQRITDPLKTVTFSLRKHSSDHSIDWIAVSLNDHGFTSLGGTTWLDFNMTSDMFKDWLQSGEKLTLEVEDRKNLKYSPVEFEGPPLPYPYDFQGISYYLNRATNGLKVDYISRLTFRLRNTPYWQLGSTVKLGDSLQELRSQSNIYHKWINGILICSVLNWANDDNQNSQIPWGLLESVDAASVRTKRRPSFSTFTIPTLTMSQEQMISYRQLYPIIQIANSIPGFLQICAKDRLFAKQMETPQGTEITPEMRECLLATPDIGIRDNIVAHEFVAIRYHIISSREVKMPFDEPLTALAGRLTNFKLVRITFGIVPDVEYPGARPKALPIPN